MKIAMKFGLIAGLLIAVLAVFSGCLTGTEPTSTAGGEAEPTFWSQWGMIIFIVVIFGIFYLLMIRPQRRRQKEHQEMMQSLQRGDKVITAGGIYGTIDSLSDDSVVIKTEGGSLLRVSRGSVAMRREELR
jgi:preprotein translocase subunit YajC